MSAQVAADLRAAADVLERDGWTQNRYHDLDGCHCVLGALAVVISDKSARPNPDRWRPGSENTVRLITDARVLARTLGEGELFPRLVVSLWNDDPQQSQRQVIATLRAAADAAEADGA